MEDMNPWLEHQKESFEKKMEILKKAFAKPFNYTVPEWFKLYDGRDEGEHNLRNLVEKKVGVSGDFNELVNGQTLLTMLYTKDHDHYRT